MSETESDLPKIIAPPPLIYVTALALGLVLDRIWPMRLFDSRVALPFGAVMVLCGIAAVAWSFHAMRRSGTPVNPYKPTASIVTAGPYRFSRNPIYVGNAALYVGLALTVNALWLFLLLPVLIAVLQVGVIAREERYLERKFGEDYARYKRSVRRWL